MAQIGKLVIEVESNTKHFDKQIEYTRQQLEQLEEIAKTLELHIDVGDNKEKLVEVNAKIEQVKNNLVDLYNKQSKNKGFGFKEGLKDLKKFALGLIGIRGIYSMVRKASSAWLSQDTELAKKFENIWLTLGAALAPILEMLAELMYKLLGYLNEFVKAFTNGRVDIIATANAKALQKQANAMKELKNQTYGFDELNIQQVNDTSNSGSTASGMIPEIELNPKIKEYVQTIGSVLGDIWGHLRNIIKWCNEHLGVGGTILLGIAAIIGVKALTGGSGLLGMLAVITAIITGIEWIKNNMPEPGDYTEKTETAYSDFEKGGKKAVESGKYTQEEVDTISKDRYFKDLESSLDLLEDKTKELTDQTLGTRIINNLLGRNDSIGTVMRNEKKISDETIKNLLKMAKQGKLTKNEIAKLYSELETYYKTVKNEADKMGWDKTEELNKIKNYMSELKSNYNISINLKDGIIPKIEYIGNELNDLDGKEANTEVDTKDNATSKIKGIETNLSNLDGKIAHTTVETTIVAEDKTKGTIDKITKNFNSLAQNIAKNPSIGGMLSAILKFTANPLSYGATGGVLNKCASGSIINNPGRGVYLGSSTIGGESGKEGLIPLTDPNAMTELGETIGRYITVNLTNITELDGKTINRENKRISNEMDFIRNGGVI